MHAMCADTLVTKPSHVKWKWQKECLLAWGVRAFSITPKLGLLCSSHALAETSWPRILWLVTALQTIVRGALVHNLPPLPATEHMGCAWAAYS